MNESLDRALADWLHEGPENGPRDGLERALAMTRRAGQRPGWTLPERWLPMQLTMDRTRSQRPILVIVILALLIVALVATALFVGSQWRQPPPPFHNGAIVYERDGDLFIADQLNGMPRMLVAGPESDSNPVFSPQGDRIAYVRNTTRMGVSWIMTVRPDGSDVTELASTGSIGLRLAWAPDGSAILAGAGGTHGAGVQRSRLLLIQSDGSGSRMLDAGPDIPAGPASWRSDGRQIAFLGWQEDADAPGVYVAHADGTDVRRLPLDSLVGSSGLEWSPDGSQLGIVGVNPTVVGFDADGTMTASHQLPLDPESTVEPAITWSPDGSNLALMLREGSTLRIGIFEPDGSGYRIVGPAVTNLGTTHFAWSPDGRSIVINGHALREDPDTLTNSWVEKAWSVDVTTGEQTEVQTPVDSWQRLAP
jgi:Tol biopolymer transport system component